MNGLQLTTERLELLAATPELMALELEDLSDFSRLLSVHVPQGWPPKLVGNLIDSFVIERLKEFPRLLGWSYWYWILRERAGDLRILIGRSHFCPPRLDGTVEIAYEVLEQFRGLGYGTEGVKALTEWATSHPQVTRVIADAYSVPSVRVLEKSGFLKICERSNMTRFETVCVMSDLAQGADALRESIGLLDTDQAKGRPAWLKRWFGK